MKNINYILEGFGFKSTTDLRLSLFGYIMKSDILAITGILASARSLFQNVIGVDVIVVAAFVSLVFLETYTGIKVSFKVDKVRFKSRIFGRMLLKVFIYITMLAILNVMAGIEMPELFGLNVNPFRWLYYMIFTGIVMQLIISCFENLGKLGYKEAKGLTGFILRTFNKWFEFDGSKNNNDETRDS